MKIAVLLGGTSAERDVSFSSGVAIARALAQNGHNVQAIDCAYGDRRVDFYALEAKQLVQTTPSDIARDKERLDRNIFVTIDYLLREKFAVVFNALHGGYGENGQLQSLLDLAGIPYTGSGMVASALGMDKHLSKLLFQADLVPTAPWEPIRSKAEISEHQVEGIGYPVVVKPNSQGSTVGLTIVREFSELDAALDLAFQYDDMALLEQYIPGKEITVALLEGEALPVLEIIPEGGLYDYEAKYQTGKTRYEVPARIPEELARDVQEAGLRAYAALNCEGYARADFRLREDDKFFCLEVNTLPGMTATSLVPKAAKARGMDFNQLVERIVELAF